MKDAKLTIFLFVSFFILTLSTAFFMFPIEKDEVTTPNKEELSDVFYFVVRESFGEENGEVEKIYSSKVDAETYIIQSGETNLYKIKVFKSK